MDDKIEIKNFIHIHKNIFYLIAMKNLNLELLRNKRLFIDILSFNGFISDEANCKIEDFKNILRGDNIYLIIKSAKEIIHILKNEVSMIAIKNKYPHFFIKNFFKYIEISQQLIQIEFEFSDNDSKCLPSEWNYLFNLNSIFILKSESITFFENTDYNQTDPFNYKIDPTDFYSNGVALSFWFREDKLSIPDYITKLFKGTLMSEIILSYSLSKRNDAVYHSFKINEVKKIKN